MNKKGQVTMGMLILMFVAVVVGVSLFVVVAQQTGGITNTDTLENLTITAPANGGTFDFTDYKSLTGVIIYNATGGQLIEESNYTISNNFLTNGNLVVRLTVDEADFENENWNVSATETQGVDYINDSGSRSMTLLIPIFFALAIFVAVLSPITQGKILEMMGK